MARTLEQLQKQYQSAPSQRGGMRPGPGRGGPGGRGGMGGKPKNMKNTVSRLLKYISVYKYHFIIVFLCLLITTVTSSAGTYFLKPILDNLAGGGNQQNDFAHRIIVAFSGKIGLSGLSNVMEYTVTGVVILGFIYIVASLSTYIQSKIMLHISQNSIEKIRKELFDKVHLPVKFHDTRTTGEIMSRFTNDVDNIGVMLDSAIISVVSGTATVICTLFFMLYTNVPLTVITIVFLPVFARGGIAIGKMSRKYYRGQQAALGAVNGYIEESVTGQKVVKVFNHENECIEEFGELNGDLRDKQFKAQFYGGIMGPVMGNMNKISYAITAGVGGILCVLTSFGVIENSSVMALTFGGLTAFVSFANHFSRPLFVA